MSGNSESIESFVAAVSSIVGTDRPVALHEPRFTGRESAYVQDCLESGWVSYLGAYVDRFANELAAYVGVRHVIPTTSGTAALHLALVGVGVRRDDEVLIPSLTFVATANAVSYCGAIPHFVDSEHEYLGLCPERLSDHLNTVAQLRVDGTFNRHTGRRISAIIPMHTFGHPCDMDALCAVADRWNLKIVEDSAESLGSTFKARHTGSLGHTGILSFNGNKTITTGGGGAVLTNDDTLAALFKHLSTTARVPAAIPFGFEHDQVGYNYRMPNINAAVGCAQLEVLPEILMKKRALANAYDIAFRHVEGARFVSESEVSTCNYWLNTVVLEGSLSGQRDALLRALNDQGVMARPLWTLLHSLPMYRDCPRSDLSVAERLESTVINLPSSPHLGAAFSSAVQ